MIDRRSFLALGASATAAAVQAPSPPAAEEASKSVSPFADPDFGFTAQIALGGSYYRGGDPGKLLAIVSRIKAGDFESAWQAYHDAGAESRTMAEQAAAKRHNVSAREAYLWAAGYFSAALRFLDGTKDPERMLPCWQEDDACWSAAGALFDPPVESTGDTLRRRWPYGVVHAGGCVAPPQAAGDPQHGRRRPGKEHVRSGRRRRTGARLQLPDPQRSGAGRFAVGAQAVLPAGLGEGHHAGGRRHAAPSRGRSQAHRAGGRQPGRLLGAAGPWHSSTASRRAWPIRASGMCPRPGCATCLKSYATRWTPARRPSSIRCYRWARL